MNVYNRLLGPVAAMSVTLLGTACAQSLPAGQPYPEKQIAAHSVTPQTDSTKLLYVGTGQTVNVYSFPQNQLTETLGGFQRTQGLCSDKAGNVFITDEFAGTITEYAHGATEPTQTLEDPTFAPYGCAIDPTSGDLAVANSGDAAMSSVAIYRNAKGPSIVFTDLSIYAFYYCTYDSKGNLFIDGANNENRGSGQLDELPRNSSNLQKVTLNAAFSPGGGVQWDGTHLALESPQGKGYDDGPMLIERVKISGGTGSVDKPVYLRSKGNKNPGEGTQFWIDGGMIVNRKFTSRGVGEWKYPAGGDVRSTIKARMTYGVTISDIKS